RDWSGVTLSPDPKPVSDPVRRERERKRAIAEAEEEADRAARIAEARRLAVASETVDHTLAERYLVETRGVPKPALAWPDSIRFHRPSRSLIVIATTLDGAVQAVQRVRLTPSARKRS